MLKGGRNKRGAGFTRRTIATIQSGLRLELRGRTVEEWLAQHPKGKAGGPLSSLSVAKALFYSLAPQSLDEELNALLTYLRESSNSDRRCSTFISCGVLQTFAFGNPRAILREAKATFADLRRSTSNVQYDPRKELAPLIKEQAEALQELQRHLGVQLNVEGDVPSFLSEVRRDRLRFQTEHDARKAVRSTEVSAVNGKINGLSLVEIAGYRERMKVQHACRLFPVSKGHCALVGAARSGNDGESASDEYGCDVTEQETKEAFSRNF